MRNLKKKGFTIVELVIVIAVIAVLAAVLIPTFSNLIKKANESVDIQLVRNMNIILEQDEATNGKPADTDAVKEILAANGIVNPTPSLADSAFAWDSEENLIVLINSDTKKGVFPKEYKDVDYKSTWKLLAGTINVTMESLGSTLEEAINNADLGQTIVLSTDQTLGATTLPKNVDIDLNGKKLTLSNGLPMVENSNITLSNGNVEGGQVTLTAGSNLVLNDVNWSAADSYAFYPQLLAKIKINGGSIIADCAIGTRYSVNQDEDPTIASKYIDIELNEVTLGSVSNPCSVGVSMINSGNVTISDCIIYASKKGVYNRAGNMIVKNTTINYMPTSAYKDVHLDEDGAGYDTPGGKKSLMWGGGSSGANAPIVVGDFHGNQYSFDANCTLINVDIINTTAYEYPDVYLSQEKCDFIDNNGKENKPLAVLKTTLTCDNTIKWVVNPACYDDIKAIVGDCSQYFIDKGFPAYEKYGGYEYSSGGYGGTVLMYVDNVFVNGVEQAAGSTSSNPVPAN